MPVTNGTVAYRKLHLVGLRLAKLDDDGSPLAGSGNLYITDTAITLGISRVYEAGDDLTQKDGQGRICTAYKTADTLKRADLTLALCIDEPELNQMLVGGSLLTDGADTIGWAEPGIGDVPDPNGLSLEAWVKNITNGRLDADYPYLRYVLPATQNWKVGDETLENGIQVQNFTGEAVENPGWLDGPANDWPHSSDSVVQRAGDTELPTFAIGSQALIAS